MKKLVLSLVALPLLALLPWPAAAGLVPQRAVLDNGMVLLTSEQRALPMVTLNLLIDAGSRHDGRAEQGLAHLTSKLLIYGTERRSALQIAETLDFIGADLSTGCEEDLASVSLTILKKDLAVGLELLADILTESAFPEAEIERQKQAVIATIRAQAEDPGDIAQKRFLAALFPNSPYGRPVEGTVDSVTGLQQSGVKAFFERYYRPERVILSAVGDISHQEIQDALNRQFHRWKKGQPTQETVRSPTPASAQVIRVNKDLTQANIILGHIGVPRGHPDYYAIQVMNYILGGGGFSSRILDSIRNERGLAYSVYSYFRAEKSFGTFQLVMQTRNETADEAIRIATEEIRRIREQGVTEEELNDAKDYLTGSFPLRFDTNRKVAAFLAQVEYLGLGLDYPNRYAELVRKVSRDDVISVARRYLHPEHFVAVIVGQQSTIDENQ